MKQKRLTEARISHALEQASTCQTIAEIYRRLGLAEHVFGKCNEEVRLDGVADVDRSSSMDGTSSLMRRCHESARWLVQRRRRASRPQTVRAAASAPRGQNTQRTYSTK